MRRWWIAVSAAVTCLSALVLAPSAQAFGLGGLSAGKITHLKPATKAWP